MSRRSARYPAKLDQLGRSDFAQDEHLEHDLIEKPVSTFSDHARGRPLRPDERELWALVARATRPLKGRSLPPLPEAPPISPAETEAAEPTARPRASASAPALSPLDRRTMRALARGRTAPDRVLDLHGMTQDKAHSALIRFLHAAQSSGDAIVLVITGKGALEPDRSRSAERGVLRRMVPHWLARPDLRRVVLGFEEAGPRQGGRGALYIRLRRERVRN